MTPARRVAHRVLLDVKRGGPLLGERLAAPDVAALDERERGFAHELVLGCLRRRGWIDHALSAVVERPLERLDVAVLEALRLGAHQILHLRVPTRAAVSESVDLVRATRHRASGLANAALRKLARCGAPPVPDADRSPLTWLTSYGSLPKWLAARWLNRLGAALAVRRARAFIEKPVTVFRLNPRAPLDAATLRADGLRCETLAVPGALRSDSAAPLLPRVRRHEIQIQDLGSQLVASLVRGERLILDACAAPGGKATLIAELNPTARVIAAEPSARRLETMRRLARDWGLPVACIQADAFRPPFCGEFDAVVVDAPCSGLGTIGRRPDVRWRVRERDIADHARKQRGLLDAAARLVRPGGTLVYATCSTEPEENESVVASFRAKHVEYVEASPPEWARSFVREGFFRTLPERDPGDAFFAAMMTRRPSP